MIDLNTTTRLKKWLISTWIYGMIRPPHPTEIMQDSGCAIADSHTVVAWGGQRHTVWELIVHSFNPVFVSSFISFSLSFPSLLPVPSAIFFPLFPKTFQCVNLCGVTFRERELEQEQEVWDEEQWTICEGSRICIVKKPWHLIIFALNIFLPGFGTMISAATCTHQRNHTCKV